MLYLKIPVLPVLLLIFLTALCASLGRWQLERMHTKQTIVENIANRKTLPDINLNTETRIGSNIVWEDLRYRQLLAKGKLIAGKQFLLDNQIHNSVPGYNIITPFLLENGKTVMVDRGWIAGEVSRSSLPDIRLRDSEEMSTTLKGSGYVPYPALMWEILDYFLDTPTYSSQFWPRTVLRIDTEDFSKALATEVLPVIIRLNPNQPNGYLRVWPGPPQQSIDRHLGYAVQWFALSLLFFVILATVTVKKRTKKT